ncbi:MAG: PHP domain-containing protein [Bacteroidota bacterium]|nr:PHP domain-containing protein [Bacteroidota bacterium]
MNSKILPYIFTCLFLGQFTNAIAQVQNDEVYEYPSLNAQDYRYNIRIPDIGKYKTLKCDFHVHTVFSDGKVWPDQRVKEAWNEGLDVIAITDHIEHRVNKDILISDHNKSYEIAKAQGDAIGMVVIKGAEITRQKPLGHLNALFIQDANKLELTDPLEAIDDAVKQGGFILWNHPGWPDDKSTVYPIHEELIANKKIHGVEVFNGWEAYPKVIDWCKEYNLAPIANSDIHYTSANLYRGKLVRPMTLVFAEEYSVEGVKEALFAGRTLALYNHTLSGAEELLKSLIEASISIRVINEKNGTIEIINNSDISYEVKCGGYMYARPLYPQHVLRVKIDKGSDVEFLNCLYGKDKHVTLKLW